MTSNIHRADLFRLRLPFAQKESVKSALFPVDGATSLFPAGENIQIERGRPFFLPRGKRNIHLLQWGAESNPDR